MIYDQDTQLEYVLGWLMDNDPVGALRLVAALEGYFVGTRQIPFGARLTEEAVTRFITLGSSDEAAAAAIPPALLAAANLALRQGDQELAHKRAHDCIRAAILVEDRATAALAHVTLAQLARQRNDPDEMAKHSRKATELDPKLNVAELLAARD